MVMNSQENFHTEVYPVLTEITYWQNVQFCSQWQLEEKEEKEVNKDRNPPHEVEILITQASWSHQNHGKMWAGQPHEVSQRPRGKATILISSFSKICRLFCSVFVCLLCHEEEIIIHFIWWTTVTLLECPYSDSPGKAYDTHHKSKCIWTIFRILLSSRNYTEICYF